MYAHTQEATDDVVLNTGDMAPSGIDGTEDKPINSPIERECDVCRKCSIFLSFVRPINLQ